MVDEGGRVGIVGENAINIQVTEVRSKQDIEGSLFPEEVFSTSWCHANHRLGLPRAGITRWGGVEMRLTTAEGSFKRARVVIKYNAPGKGYLCHLAPEITATVGAGVISTPDGTINTP